MAKRVWGVTKSHKTKETQLGMKLGTAHHQLRVRIMFWLAGRCGLLDCFRCGDPISSEADMSIDHKKPWVGDNTDLYWDMGNIAFAHKACNYSAHRAGYPPNHGIEFRKSGPAGTAWCGGHKRYLPIAKFSKNRSRWNGLQDVCIICRSNSRSKRQGTPLPSSTKIT